MTAALCNIRRDGSCGTPNLRREAGILLFGHSSRRCVDQQYELMGLAPDTQLPKVLHRHLLCRSDCAEGIPNASSNRRTRLTFHAPVGVAARAATRNLC